MKNLIMDYENTIMFESNFKAKALKWFINDENMQKMTIFDLKVLALQMARIAMEELRELELKQIEKESKQNEK